MNMRNDRPSQIEKVIKERTKRKWWQRAVSILSAVAVFCTTYAMILPAITWERSLVCEIPEHHHDDSCYETVTVPAEKRLVCTLEAHAHGAECYEQVLICTEEEREGHTHGEGCYERTLICTEEECEGHTHSEGCFNEAGELTCGLEEKEGHSHSEACYREELVCQLEEVKGHTHSEACYESRLICSAEEHTHTDECYEIVGEEHEEKVLVCQLEEHEHTAACFDAPPAEDDGYYCGQIEHTHSQEQYCYFSDGSLRCTIPEHVHTLACKSDPNADVETEAKWYSTFANVSLTGNWDEDVIAIAKTQLGYTESTRNYEVQEDGTTIKGYTRYGDWYGNSYGDWCAMFCSFCLNYAGVDREMMPFEASCLRWVEKLANKDMFRESIYYKGAKDDTTEYQPKPGDLIFFNWDEELDSDHVGLVYELVRDENDKVTEIKTIEGNNGNRVDYHTYEFTNSDIMGYGELPMNPAMTVDVLQPEATEAEITIESEPASDGAIAVVTGNIPDGAVVEIKAVTLSDEQLIGYFGEEKAASMSGFVAYDITILVNGEEWQPDESVSVTVEHPSLEIREGEKVGVAHVVSEEENKVDDVEGIEVVDGNIGFEAERFSIYILYTFTVDFHFGDTVFSIAGRSEILLSELFKELEIERNAADAVKVEFSNDTLITIEPVFAENGETIADWKLISFEPFNTNETLTIEFADGEVMEIKVTDAADISKCTVTIEDHVSETGNLLAVVRNSGVKLTQLLEGTHIEWYSSTDGQNWVRLEAQQFGSYRSITEDTTGVSVYLTGGGRREGDPVTQYKAYLCLDGQTTSNKFSAVYKQEKYWVMIRNGGFENNIVNSSFAQLFDSNANLIWKDAVAHQVEIGSTRNINYLNDCAGSYRVELFDTGKMCAAEGYNFAEINCEAPGALYQTILSQPGQELYWHLYHAARIATLYKADNIARYNENKHEKDVMYVICMDEEEAIQLINSTRNNLEKQKQAIRDIENGTSIYTSARAYRVETAIEEFWKYHSNANDPYVVPEGQYQTRMFFWSFEAFEDTARNTGGAMGNMVDDIGFSAEIPPTPDTPEPPDTVTISKTFTGLTAEQIARLTDNFCITITNAETGEIAARLSLLEEPAEGLTAPHSVSGGGMKYTWKIDLTDGRYIVSESGADVAGYHLFVTGTGVINITRRTDDVPISGEYEIAEGYELELSDDIISSGNVIATVKLDGVEATLPEGTHLEWFKSTNGTDWEQIIRTEYVTGNGNHIFNIPEDTLSVNVSLTNGARTSSGAVQYKAVIYADTGEASSVESDVFLQNTYWGEIQNGSFETPVVAAGIGTVVGGYNGDYFYAEIPSGSNGASWKSAVLGAEVGSPGLDIELVRTETENQRFGAWTSYHNVPTAPADDYKNFTAAEGKQFAEINCEADGALYQDILTEPGTTMYWQLAHRARREASTADGTVDTMYVVCMSVSQAENLTSGPAMRAAVSEILDGDPNENYPGAVAWTVSDNADQWVYHNDSFVVPDGQYLTRFFFVASDENAVGRLNAGNLVDDISLSTSLPPVENQYARVIIQKEITGVPADKLEDLRNNLLFEYSYDTTSNSVLGSDMTWTATGTGNFILTIPVQNGSVDFSLAEDATSADLDGYSRLTAVISTGSGTYTNDTYRVTIYGGDIITITVDNTYTPDILIDNEYDPGYRLPETGGIGVYPIYALGALFVAGSITYGFILRRKRERRAE